MTDHHIKGGYHPMAMPELVKENERLREAVEYMADPHNWIEEDGWLQMKRPGGGGQRGIILISHNLNPCTYLAELRARSGVKK